MAAHPTKRRATDAGGEDGDGDRDPVRPTRSMWRTSETFPEIKEAKNIRFGFYPEHQRCRPVDPSRSIEFERKMYDTLRDCVIDNPIPRGVPGSDIPDELQRLISGWVASGDNLRGDDALLYVADRDREETKDLLHYYSCGQYDVVVALLEAGYGVHNLDALISRVLINARGTNRRVLDTILEHPKWLIGVDASSRIELLNYLINKIKSEVEAKRQTWDQAKEALKIWTTQLFPIMAEDVANLDQARRVLKQSDQKLDTAVSEAIVQSFLNLASINAYSNAIIMRGLIQYAMMNCNEDQRTVMGNPLIRAIRSTDRKELDRVDAELKLKSAWYLLNKAYPNEDYKGYGDRPEKIKASIAELIAQGMGRCVSMRREFDNTLESQSPALPYLDFAKQIVRPLVKRYNPIDPDDQNYNIFEQLRIMIAKASDEDIKDLADFVSRLDLRIASNRVLLQGLLRLTDKCKSTDVGCASLTSLIGTRLTQ